MNESISEEEVIQYSPVEKKSIHLSALTSTCSIWDPLEPADIKLDLWNLDYLPSPLIDQLTCSICQCVFVEPYSTKCGHTFCKHCLFQALSRSASATASYTSSSVNLTNNSENRNSSTLDSSLENQQSPEDTTFSDATSVPTSNTTTTVDPQQQSSTTVTIHSKCPIDRSPLSTNSSDISPAPVVISNLANDLMAYCPNKKRGCKHTCQRWMIEPHLLQECQYTLFKCNAVKDDGSICEEALERKFIIAARELSIQDYKDTHRVDITPTESKSTSPSPVKFESQSDSTISKDQNDEKNPRIFLSDLTVYCPHEDMECPSGCGMSFSRYKLSKHLKTECPEYESQCYICGAAVSRKDLEKHLENTCPESIISCKATDIGCMWVGKRKEFQTTHKRTCSYLQFQPILKQQNKRITKLENENKSLRYQFDRLLSRFPQSEPPNLINNDNSSISLSLLSEANIPRSTSGNQQRRSSNNTNSNGQQQGRQQSSQSAQFTESDIMHIFMEGQRLREDVDRIGNQLGDMEIRHGISIMQENFRTGEEINSLRALINSLRHQIHFLLAERRSWAMASMHQQQQQFQQQSSQLSSHRSVDSLDQTISNESTPAPRRLSGKKFFYYCFHFYF